MFSSNPDFGIMEQAYMKLKTQSMCLVDAMLLMLTMQTPIYSLPPSP